MDVYAYNDCVHQWTDALFRFACKCTGNEEDARDIVQNSFVVLWEKREAVPSEKAKPFLFQVAYRQSIDHYRKRKDLTGEELPDTAATADGSNPDLKKVLDHALSKLDEQSRALVLLKDYEGYKYEEIARITGLTDAQVRVYLHRARKTLKSFIVRVDNLI